MTKKEIALSAVEALKNEYPDAKCSLDYQTPLQLLIATRLSAQCTDARVNLVTPALFERFPSAGSLAEAEPSEVAEYIKSCGLYKTKSKDLVAMAKMLVSEFGGGAVAGRHGDKWARFTEENQAMVYEANLRMFDRIDGLAGISPWILKDFMSPRRPLRGTQDFYNRKGLISDKGERKAAFGVLKNWYEKK